ncbi:MAG TPA: hypothetical protein QGF05_09860 [Dehalococcoidia bacterium]|nr:hypothetical protein [Dehalococcoidia bacterium]
MAKRSAAQGQVESFNASVDDLLLDVENPRLASVLETKHAPKQDELLRSLYEEMEVDEVALSIAENGYYPEERLLAVGRDKPFAHRTSLLRAIGGSPPSWYCATTSFGLN